ncbi:MAG: MerR family transcriptional regulator [Clostridiaceae bacterium]|nr:MerR family transcriptional regulator [Clostridiaceae bacterium]
MEVLKDRYSITELSGRLNVTDHTLRYYEKEFNMGIPKDKRGRRYYTPELANLMYQIKTMRDDGLEIKAIKKILQSENLIKEPPPVLNEVDAMSLTNSGHQSDIKIFFKEFEEQITNNFSMELTCARDYLSSELNKTKLELGACFENNVRKLEGKLDKHFENVDRSIGMWRERNKGGIFKRLRKIVFKT